MGRLKLITSDDGIETLIVHESDAKLLAGLLGRVIIRGQETACGLRVRVWGEGSGSQSPEQTPPVCER